MKRWGLLMVSAVCLLLASCSLLPEEEQFKTAPLIREYEREAYDFTFVERGDMKLTEKISLTYVPVQTETLRYKVGGLYFDEAFVQAGDAVEAGQLLAQLDLSGIEDEIKTCDVQIEKLNIRMETLEKNRALALERNRIEANGAAEAENALKQTNREYDRQKQALEDEMTILKLQKAEYEQQMAERQLRAGISGTVTYVRSTKPGERSVAGERFMTIADATMSLFKTDTTYWAYFEPGQEFMITVSKAEYEAVVTCEEELGLPEAEKIEGKVGAVYLKLKNPSFEMEDGAKGTIELVLDTREDVLMVSQSAVSEINGQTVVYYQKEDGMKAYKPVETGLIANRMVEIVSGLTEGEQLITK